MAVNAWRVGARKCERVRGFGQFMRPESQSAGRSVGKGGLRVVAIFSRSTRLAYSAFQAGSADLGTCAFSRVAWGASRVSSACVLSSPIFHALSKFRQGDSAGEYVHTPSEASGGSSLLSRIDRDSRFPIRCTDSTHD